jgi:succinate dehydrogenase / fumarate reductase flavoprotein subunit
MGRKKTELSEEDRDYYYLEKVSFFGNLVPRDVASRAAKERSDAGFELKNRRSSLFRSSQYSATEKNRHT